jgi:DHA2 family multidrug resistance protein
VVTWIVLSRHLPRNQGPLRYYLAGFSALLLCGWQLSHLSELAEPLAAVLPSLWLHGAFLILVLATTAMQTFQKLPQENRIFSHANQVKNMFAQFGIAAGFALATFCLQWRASAHYAALGDSLSRSNTALQSSIDQLSNYFALTHGAATAHQLAIAQVAHMLAGEATFMATQDYFSWVTGFAALAVLIVLALAVVNKLLQRAPPV